MTGIGMLTLTGNNVAMDSFGPISDNANGIGEMSWSGMDDPETNAARKIMADLDAVGNTTKAITKGVAIGSAVIAAVSLFGSFLVDVGRGPGQRSGVPLAERIAVIGIRIDMPQVFVGMLIGGALPWLFSSFAIQAVARAAGLIVEEVRRQFRLGVLEGKVKPDYRQAVGDLHHAAQKELIAAGPARRPDADRRRPGPPGRGPRRFPGRDHPLRPAAGGVHEQRRRRVGQRQEADRGRTE